MIQQRIEQLTDRQRDFLRGQIDLVQNSRPTPASKRLVAWITCYGVVNESELHERLKATLPTAALPHEVIELDEFPRTTTGKTDRRQLASSFRQAQTSPTHERKASNATELKLQAIWGELLGDGNPSTEQDFFQAGGDSLKVIQLVAMGQERGIQVSPELVYQNPTIRELAMRIDHHGRLDFSSQKRLAQDAIDLPLDSSGVSSELHDFVREGPRRGPIPLSIETDGPPLIFMPPMGNQLGHYWSLISEVSGYSCIALSTEDSDVWKTWTIDELVNEYLDQLREVQPSGPYRLVGYCEGGYAAWQMARRLTEMGEEVAFVGLLESPNPDGLQRTPETFRQKTARRLGSIRKNSSDGLLKHLVHRTTDWTTRRLRRAVTGERHLTRGGKRMAWLFHPEPYQRPATLFRVAEQSMQGAFTTDATYGWGSLANGGLDVRIISGTRLTFLQPPNAKLLARQLIEALRYRDSVR